MTTLRFLGVGTRDSFDDEMCAAAAAGLPNLDNVTNPDVIGAYGIEEDTDDCPQCTGPMPYGDPCCPDCEESDR